ncbi:Proteasome subunit family protein [Babesia bovis T2Bo]|uniref:Proteasome subunit beta n=1 Tax=Babesia bovis TaxID=5865 RepID=A7AUD6_BABBO|nr:Proteasome subunit family protein [Babesia bovis T2Bo]EDO06547.1 Proteasome subunit family protein [Babesia bovis T2Bo]BAN64362.1 proteosome A, putative [Babesia bovis]|eukprot:XP_001610115.1 proteosome A [Babesia bovis T2Bo]
MMVDCSYYDGISEAGIAQECVSGSTAADDRAHDISMGTTIIAMIYRDGILLAADSRTSSGPIVVNRVARKITRILPNVFMLRSGSAADSQMLSVIVRYHAQALCLQLRKSGRASGDDAIGSDDAMQIDSEMPTESEYSYRFDESMVYPPLKALATATHKIVHEYREQLYCGIILGGYDMQHGPEIYNVTLGGTLLKVPHFVASGSGSGYITAFLHDNYEPDMSRDQCLSLLKRAIKYAIDIDNSSGGLMRAVSVSRTGVSEFCFTF